MNAEAPEQFPVDYVPEDPEVEIERIQSGVSYKTERMTILGRYSFLVSCQFLLCFMLTYETLFDGTLTFECYPDNISVVMTRFICGTVLHFNLQPEMAQGLKMMKYSVNHPWKFRNVGAAWFIGFSQCNMV